MRKTGCVLKKPPQGGKNSTLREHISAEETKLRKVNIQRDERDARIIFHIAILSALGNFHKFISSDN